MSFSNSIRIIGGRFRGRKLLFPENSHIRPTLDQVRETLFNWLQSMIVDARCLDAFAGSGALGIEALSRGASHVTFIDKDQNVLKQIKQHLKTLGAENYSPFQASMPQALTQIPTEPYDIIFLDPPFDSDFLKNTLALLSNSSLIKPSTLIYFETSSNQPLFFKDEWSIIKIKQTKRIRYGLLLKNQISDNMT